MARTTKRHATLLLNAIERAGEASKIEIDVADADSDFVTFADALAGGKKVRTLMLTFAQDHAADSLWTLMEENADTGGEVDGVYRPYGNATPSATQPHYEFTVQIKYPDGLMLGGEADASVTATNTIDVEWPVVDGTWTKVTA